MQPEILFKRGVKLTFLGKRYPWFEHNAHRVLPVVRFSIVGFVAAICYISVSSIFVYMGYTPWRVSILCYGAFIPIVYLFQRNYTFNSSAPHVSSFIKYALTQGVGLLLSGILPFILHRYLHSGVSFIMVSLAVAVFNYFFISRWAFRYEEDRVIDHSKKSP